MQGTNELYATVAESGDCELVKRLRSEGLLYAVNKLVLHPVGLALCLTLDDEGEVSSFGIFETEDDDKKIIYSPELNREGQFRLVQHHPELHDKFMEAGLLPKHP